MERPRSSVLRTSHNLWLTIAMIIVIAIAVYSYLDSQAFREAASGAERSRLLAGETQELLSHVKDAETSQTGYLLTRDPSYLEAYNQSLSRIATAQRVLSRPQVADPEDCARLSVLITARLERSEERRVGEEERT